MTVSRRFSGPAVTVNLNVTGHVMSVDLAPMAFLSIPFSDDLQWPEPGQMWPANDMVIMVCFQSSIVDIGIQKRCICFIFRLLLYFNLV